MKGVLNIIIGLGVKERNRKETFHSIGSKRNKNEIDKFCGFIWEILLHCS